jgi:hypothetical protein
MAEVKYINGTGKNSQYDFRYFDNVTDSSLNDKDFLVSPDEINWFFKNNTYNTRVKNTLPGQDNLLLNTEDNRLTTNTTIITE